MDRHNQYIQAKNAYKALLKQRGSGLYCFQDKEVVYNNKSYDGVCTHMSYKDYFAYISDPKKYIDDFTASLKIPNNPVTECLLYILDSYTTNVQTNNRLLWDLFFTAGIDDLYSLLLKISENPKYRKYWYLKMPSNSPSEWKSHCALHFAVSVYNDTKYLDFWLHMANYPDVWKVALPDSMQGTTPLHFACEQLVHKKFSEFWEKMADYPDIWKLQKTDAIVQVDAGSSPLHSACNNLSDLVFVKFWLKMAEYPVLWKLQKTDIAGQNHAKATPLHIAATTMSNIGYLDFWKKMAAYPDVWKLQMSDAAGQNSAGKTPLHSVCDTLKTVDFIEFWKILATHSGIWKIQRTDKAGEQNAGQTPLHKACNTFSSVEFLDFWLKLAEHSDIWKTQLRDIAGVDIAGFTPLHLACGKLTDVGFLDFWLKMADHSDIWKIQATDAAELFFSGITPVHIACRALGHVGFVNFWLKMADYPDNDIWKIQMTDASGPKDMGATPLYDACHTLGNITYHDFWIKMIEKPDIWNVKFPYRADNAGATPLAAALHYLTDIAFVDFWTIAHKHISSEYDIISHPVYKIAAFWLPRSLYNAFMHFEQPITVLPFSTEHVFVSHSHSSDTNGVFMLNAKTTVILLEEHKKYGVIANNKLDDVLYNTLNTKMIRIYRPFDIMLDKTISGDRKLTPHFYNSTDVLIDNDVIINADPNNLAHTLNISPRPTTLRAFIKSVIDANPDLPNITIIMAGCRNDTNNKTKYKQLCKWVSLMPFDCGTESKWFELCNFQNKLSYVDAQSDEDLQIQRLPSFASELPSPSGISDLKWMLELFKKWDINEPSLEYQLKLMIGRLELGNGTSYENLTDLYKDIFFALKSKLDK